MTLTIMWNYTLFAPDSPGIDDSSSLERHSQRLQQELKKQMPDLEVMNQLMDSEFPRRRIFIKQLDARTRVRETLAVYPILNKGNQVCGGFLNFKTGISYSLLTK